MHEHPGRTRLARGVWVLVLLYTLALLSLTLLPKVPPLVPIRVSDKMAHAVAFGGLGALALSALTLSRVGSPKRASAIAAAYALGLGALVEIVQEYVPGRSRSLTDLAADLAGIAIALSAAVAVRYARRR